MNQEMKTRLRHALHMHIDNDSNRQSVLNCVNQIEEELGRPIKVKELSDLNQVD